MKYVASWLERQKCIVEIEPVYHTSVGNRKLDIVAVKGDTAIVIDAQVRGDGTNLENAHDVKARYYRRNPNLSQKIFEKYGTITTVEFTSLTLS